MPTPDHHVGDDRLDRDDDRLTHLELGHHLSTSVIMTLLRGRVTDAVVQDVAWRRGLAVGDHVNHPVERLLHVLHVTLHDDAWNLTWRRSVDVQGAWYTSYEDVTEGDVRLRRTYYLKRHAHGPWRLYERPADSPASARRDWVEVCTKLDHRHGFGEALRVAQLNAEGWIIRGDGVASDGWVNEE